MGRFKKIRHSLGQDMLATLAEIKRRAVSLESLSLSELRELASLEVEALELIQAARELGVDPKKYEEEWEGIINPPSNPD